MKKKNNNESTQKIRDSIKSNRIYTPEDVNIFLSEAVDNIDDCLVYKKKVAYINIPCAFDIETSSFYDNGDKVAIMYIWQLGINGLCMIGRTWDEFKNVMQIISDTWKLSQSRILVVGIHNLNFEFQFMRKHFEWTNVFSIDARKPVYARCTLGIEFRCTLILSNKPLAKVGADLLTFNIDKKVGDLDYTLIRHSKTILTSEEIGYCINDIKIVMAYLQEQIEQNNNSIVDIPLTNTGYVRRYCKNETIGSTRKERYGNYRTLIKSLTIEPEEFELQRRAFAGGFTHSNPQKTRRTILEVDSDDITSSYPTVMIAEPRFPMTKGEKVEISSMEEFEHNIKLYACIFDIELIDVEPKVLFDNYISYSKCYAAEGCILSNGRVVSADRICLSITEIDWEIIQQFYHIKHISIGTFYRYRRGYLPTKLVKSILELYRIKTEYKGIEEKQFEYMLAKGQLNSAYGMMVFNPIRPTIQYDTDWSSDIPNLEDALNEYNNSYSRFTTYTWGIYVTALARRNLMSAILEYKDDYVYADTDSIKGINREKHKQFFDDYNQNIKEKLYLAMDRHGLPHERVEPKDKNGIKHLLGVWDYEGHYSQFKTLGSKRYLYKEDNDVHMTVAGLGKKVACKWLVDSYGDMCFDAFDDDLNVPAEYTGKLTHTYIDEERHGIVIDYQGNICEYHELSGVHLEQAEYSLNMSVNYIDYLAMVSPDNL